MQRSNYSLWHCRMMLLLGKAAGDCKLTVTPSAAASMLLPQHSGLWSQQGRMACAPRSPGRWGRGEALFFSAQVYTDAVRQGGTVTHKC